MDNIDNTIGQIQETVENIQQESVDTVSVETEVTAESTELTDDEIDAILNEAAAEIGVEIPNAVESEHNIKPNSPTILLDETHSRFSGAEWALKIKEQNVVLGGCGGISSWVALLLSRVNPNYIYIYDDDVVEQSNMSGQLFRNIDIGSSKVRSMYTIITQFSSYYNIVCNNVRFHYDSGMFNNIMISGFDNMQARKEFYQAWKRGIYDDNREKCLLIDGRIKMLKHFLIWNNFCNFAA